MNEKISLDELFRVQQESGNTATIEAIAGDDTAVRITPWRKHGGCACRHMMKVPKAAIAELTRTGEVHECCGQTLQVVAITFGDATWANVFSQMAGKAQAATRSASGNSSASTLRRFTDTTDDSASGHDDGGSCPRWECMNQVQENLGYCLDNAVGDPAAQRRCGRIYASQMARCRILPPCYLSA